MAYILTVGLRNGLKLACPDGTQLDDLGFEIIDRKHLDNDHLFCFEFPGRRSTDLMNPFGMVTMKGDMKITSKLSDLKLTVGSVFEFVHDMGDDVRFKIKVLEITDEKLSKIKKVTDAAKKPAAKKTRKTAEEAK